MQIKTGQYTGDGADSRGITGVGFQPDVVIVKRQGSGGTSAICKTDLIAGDNGKPMAAATALTADTVQSLDADGFTVGTSGYVNASGQTYNWLALKKHASDCATGQYTGDGTDSRSVTGVGFQPNLVIVMSQGATIATWRQSSGFSGDDSANFNDGGDGADRIQALEADGFQVGTHAEVNTNTTVYDYVAIKTTAGFIHVGTYTGDGVDNRSITGAGFQPDFAHVQRVNGFADRPTGRNVAVAGDLSWFYQNDGAVANLIQALEADGIQVGTAPNVNANTPTYAWWALKEGNSQAGGGGSIVPIIMSYNRRRVGA